MSERLPSLKAKDLIRLLQKDGFLLVHQKGSHATYKHPLTQKRVTVPIHPGRDLKRGLLKGILNDLNMTNEEFVKKLKG
ncbi:MAG: type II toxin-antitoxin system HicA family toxin [Candidatus Omnitrophica bacterium]|nr:type II toxin-antitoxin system HicA family toxin [Candidatus Omnitrophota bacterium]